MSANEAFSRINHFIPSFASDDLALDSLERSSGYMPRVAPLFEVRFFHHAITSLAGTNPSLSTSMLAQSGKSQTECHDINVLGEPPSVSPVTKATSWPSWRRDSAAASQVAAGCVPLMLAEVAVSGPHARSSAFAAG